MSERDSLVAEPFCACDVPGDCPDRATPGCKLAAGKAQAGDAPGAGFDSREASQSSSLFLGRDEKPLCVLVCGSRDWNRPTWIGRRLSKLPRGSKIIHGAARGADLFASTYADALGIEQSAFPADWRGKGKRAGILRNLEMLDQKPDLVIAFWTGGSTGTKHTIDEARKRGIPVHVVTEELGEVGVLLTDRADDDLDAVGQLEGEPHGS